MAGPELLLITAALLYVCILPITLINLMTDRQVAILTKNRQSD